MIFSIISNFSVDAIVPSLLPFIKTERSVSCTAFELFNFPNCSSGEAWVEVFNVLGTFKSTYKMSIINRFLQEDLETFSPDNRVKISTKLRKEIINLIDDTDIDYAESTELQTKLEEAFIFIEPENLVDRYEYLFQESTEVIPCSIDGEEVHSLEKLQAHAITSIVETSSLEELKALVLKSYFAGTIGILLSEIYEEQYAKEMLVWLSLDDTSLNICARCYFENSILTPKRLQNLNGKQIAELLLSQPFDATLIAILKKQHHIVQKIFWKSIKFLDRFTIQDIKHAGWILNNLIKNEVFEKVTEFYVHLIHLYKQEKFAIDYMSITKFLMEKEPNILTVNTKHIEQIISFLYEFEALEEPLRLIEWRFINLTRVKPLIWEKKFIKNPNEIIKLIEYVQADYNNEKYRIMSDGDGKINMATSMENLLDKLDLFRNKEVDSHTLYNWAKEVISLINSKENSDLNCYILGRLLSKSPQDEHGTFPNQAVCNILEDFVDIEMERGFVEGVRYVRNSTEKLGYFERDALELELMFPKVAGVLRGI